MTAPDLISAVLNRVWLDFYAPDRVHEFFRDGHAIEKSIKRYGHECFKRGWEPEPEFIVSEILRVLRSARKCRADIRHLPSYLDVALTKAIGQRAEEIRAASLCVGAKAARILRTTEVVQAVREPSVVEILSMMHKATPKRVKATGWRQRRLL